MTDPDPRLLLIGLAAALRVGGIAVDSTRVARAAEALSVLRPLDPARLYWAARVTLCSRVDQTPVFDRVFLDFFGAVPTEPVDEALATPDTPPSDGIDAADAADGSVLTRQPAASGAQRLPSEVPGVAPGADDYAVAAEVIAAALPPRRSARRQPGGRAELDLRHIARELGRTGGEVLTLHHRQRSWRARNLLLLIDVSASMEKAGSVEPMLRFAHALVRHRPEATAVFTLGRQATHITPLLAHPEVAEALKAVYGHVRDRSGGTMLGQALHSLLRAWGGRRATSSATTILASDGYVADLVFFGHQLARLARRSRRIVWLDPTARSDPGYRATAQAMVQNTMHIYEFLGGRNGEALRALASTLART